MAPAPDEFGRREPTAPAPGPSSVVSQHPSGKGLHRRNGSKGKATAAAAAAAASAAANTNHPSTGGSTRSSDGSDDDDDGPPPLVESGALPSAAVSTKSKKKQRAKSAKGKRSSSVLSLLGRGGEGGGSAAPATTTAAGTIKYAKHVKSAAKKVKRGLQDYFSEKLTGVRVQTLHGGNITLEYVRMVAVAGLLVVTIALSWSTPLVVGGGSVVRRVAVEVETWAGCKTSCHTLPCPRTPSVPSLELVRASYRHQLFILT